MSIAKSLRRRLIKISLFIVSGLVLACVFTLIGLLYGVTELARSLPDLQGWHRQAPSCEFTADDEIPGYTFDDYLEQEGRVFDELKALMDGPWANEAGGTYCRFQSQSICNPATIAERNWNRSHILEADNPRGGALLVHGLSDSPYSLRALGQRLHEEGYTVIWLRVPGHGTCPKALAEAKWEDWAAAMRIAVRGLRERLPDEAPLVIAGFSNGGAITLDYTISSVRDDAPVTLPRPDAIVLFSPMIGVSDLAWLTEYHPWVSGLSGEQKADWQEISAAVDPFKYSSWPMNASMQAYRLTMRLEQRLAVLADEERMADFPPVLTVQSAVDSTVTVESLLVGLYERLDNPQSELMLIDVNRGPMLEDLLDLSYQHPIKPHLLSPDRKFRIAVLTNAGTDSSQLVLKSHDGKAIAERPLDLLWPSDVFSLSHGAIPIPPDDPILGTREASQAGGLSLGSLNLRGEHGVLRISEGLMMRLRHNPFYAFQEDRVIQWLEEVADTP